MRNPALFKVRGKDRQPHLMTLSRKAGRGVGYFRDVTKPMSGVERQYVRSRAKRATQEAWHREWILLLPASLIERRVI